jgi:hypothetical protein
LEVLSFENDAWIEDFAIGCDSLNHRWPPAGLAERDTSTELRTWCSPCRCALLHYKPTSCILLVTMQSRFYCTMHVWLLLAQSPPLWNLFPDWGQEEMAGCWALAGPAPWFCKVGSGSSSQRPGSCRPPRSNTRKKFLPWLEGC